MNSSNALRPIIILGGLGLAVAAAWSLRPAAPVEKIIEKISPAEIIAQFPAPDPSTETGRTTLAALQKLRAQPTEAARWISLGDALAQEQRDSANPTFYDHAERAYQTAHTLQPQLAPALTGLAWVAGGRHQFPQSIDWAQQAIAVDAENATACGILGDAALELGHYDEALDHYQKMMDLRPDLSSWSRGAHLLWITGNKSKATWLMERALKAGAPFAENTAWCRAKLAMMHFSDGALKPAAQVLEPAIQAGSKNIHVLLAAGRIATALGDVGTARAHYATILTSGPQHDALCALGDLCAAEGHAEEAETYFTQVETLHQQHLATAVHDHMAMAKFYADHERNLVEALRLGEQAKLTQNVLEADVLAWVYLKNHDLPHAVETMKRALRQHTPDAEMEYHAGCIAAAAGDTNSATRHLQAALSYNPQFSISQAPLAVKALADLAPTSTVTSHGE